MIRRLLVSIIEWVAHKFTPGVCYMPRNLTPSSMMPDRFNPDDIVEAAALILIENIAKSEKVGAELVLRKVQYNQVEFGDWRLLIEKIEASK